MFEHEMPGDIKMHNNHQDHTDVVQALILFVILSAATLASSWLLSVPDAFSLSLLAQVAPVLVSAIALFGFYKIQNHVILKLSIPVVFTLNFTSWGYALYVYSFELSGLAASAGSQELVLFSSMSNLIYLFGMAISIILLHRYCRFAVYISSLMTVTLVVLLFVFSSYFLNYLFASLILLSSVIVLSVISKQVTVVENTIHKAEVDDPEFLDSELLPSEIEQEEIIPELAINALPLNDNLPTHDWETVLRDLQDELKGCADVDKLFSNMLTFLNDRIGFEAAAVGMLQERSIKRIASSGDDQYIHSQCLGWNSQRIKELFASKEPILSRQSQLSISDNGAADSLHRLDIPVLSNNKAVGIVTLFRETMLFDTHDVKLASAIVFHSMLSLRNARLQEEVKRLSVSQATTNLTLFSREQFVQKIQPVLEKIGKPRECTLFIVDVDNYSDINDKVGREAANLLYKAVSKKIISQLTDNDVIGRYGNEGFVVLMDETDLNQGKHKAENIRESVSQLKVNYQDQALATTISIGLTIVTDPDDNLSTLMRKADMGLFVAKENGSNTVKVSL